VGLFSWSEMWGFNFRQLLKLVEANDDTWRVFNPGKNKHGKQNATSFFHWINQPAPFDFLAARHSFFGTNWHSVYFIKRILFMLQWPISHLINSHICQYWGRPWCNIIKYTVIEVVNFFIISFITRSMALWGSFTDIGLHTTYAGDWIMTIWWQEVALVSGKICNAFIRIVTISPSLTSLATMMM